MQALADKQEVDLLKLKNRVEAGKNRVNRLFKDTMKDDVSKNLLNANPDLVVNGRLIVYEDTGGLVFKKENYQLWVKFFSNELGRIYSTVPMIEPYDIDLTEQYELLKDFFLLIKNAYPDLDLNLLTDFSEHEQ